MGARASFFTHVLHILLFAFLFARSILNMYRKGDRQTMNIETVKKAALILAAVWLCMRVLGLIVPAILGVIGLLIKIVFWAAIALFAWAVIDTVLENKKKGS